MNTLNKREKEKYMKESKSVIQVAVDFAEGILNGTPKEDWETLGKQKFLLGRNQLAFPFTDEYLEKIWKKAKGEDWDVVVGVENSNSNQISEQKEVNEEYPPSLSHSELMTKEFPPARYILEPFFEQGTVNMISAPPNGWKSWFMFGIAGDVARGTSFLGQFKTEKTNVIIVNEEDSSRLVQDRMRLLNITDISLPIYYRIANGSKLTEEFVDSLIAEAKEKSVGLIMFDSLRSVHEADENSSTEMQKVMDLFKKIARENITVIFTHHNRKKPPFGKGDDAESTRGSSAINAAISGHISLEEAEREDGKYLIVQHLKSKVGAKEKPFEVGIIIGETISFSYLGEHTQTEKVLTESKTKILEALKDRKELLSQNDFVHFGIAGESTIKKALKMLRKEGLIKAMERKEVTRLGLEL